MTTRLARTAAVLVAAQAAVLAVAAVADIASPRPHLRAAAVGGGLMAAAGVGSLLLGRVLDRLAGPVPAYAASVLIRGFAGVGVGFAVVIAGVPPAARPVYLGWLLAAYLTGLTAETVLAARVGRAK